MTLGFGFSPHFLLFRILDMHWMKHTEELTSNQKLKISAMLFGRMWRRASTLLPASSLAARMRSCSLGMLSTDSRRTLRRMFGCLGLDEWCLLRRKRARVSRCSIIKSTWYVFLFGSLCVETVLTIMIGSLRTVRQEMICHCLLYIDCRS